VLTALSTSALATAAAHPGMWHPGFFPFFFLIPLFWIAVIVLVSVFAGRGRRRAWARGGYGPWGGPWAHAGWGGGARSAEATLAQRFANGDIDEKEYRARLEVLRASGPTPPQG
jgi:putative membrane protein